MYLTDRQSLVDYCLRRLGAPVLNIEVDDDQLADAVEDAISLYNEYHFDGVERDYVKHKITASVITLDTVVGLSAGNKLTNQNGIYASIISISNNDVTITKMLGESKFAVGDTLTSSQNTTHSISAVTLGDVDNGWLPIDEGIYGIMRVLPISTISDGLFDITYQLRMNDLRNLSGGSMNFFTATMEYLALLDFLLRKEKQFRFNRRMGKMYIDMDWKNDAKPGDYLIIECYRAVRDEAYADVLNDVWLKNYAAALIKRYWGANLRKYNGVSLPGGVTLDGERIYSEAVAEVDALKQEVIHDQSPLNFIMG